MAFRLASRDILEGRSPAVEDATGITARMVAECEVIGERPVSRTASEEGGVFSALNWGNKESASADQMVWKGLPGRAQRARPGWGRARLSLAIVAEMGFGPKEERFILWG